MSVMLTGVGAVGSHVARELQAQGHEIVIFDKSPNLSFIGSIADITDVPVVVGDVNDQEALSAAVREHKVDTILHLAGFLTKTLRAHPFAGVSLNIGGTGSVLEVARNTGVRRVVLASTRGVNQIAAAPESGDVLPEDFQMRVISDRPRTMYELSKLTCEHLGLLYADTYDMEFVALRLGGGFGPTPGEPAGLTGTVVRPLVYGAVAGGPVEITDPSLTYAGNHEFIYFKDDAVAFALACTRPNLSQRVYNIRMDRTYTYDQVVETMQKIFPDTEFKISATNSGSMTQGRAPRDDNASTEAAYNELGWRPQYDLESGVRDWVRWIEKYDISR
ncbi:NAD(P)-dependent oxidoreductase [Microbacterium soli]|uniref:dTDP-glucose 4,6-dehydratase n=1 Tax=Microbacterium soli TaxID=446075 RepID=A0ABP7NED0_9MICO